MAKLKLSPSPTFTAAAPIPVPGGEVDPVVFTFKHRDREALKAFVQAAASKDDASNILEMASGWDLPDAFTPENVALLTANYIGAGRVVFDTYLDELTKGRRGN